MAVRCAGFQGRLCFCKGVCGLQVPRSGHCVVWRVNLLVSGCLRRTSGSVGGYVECVVDLLGLLFVVCLGWLVIYPLALPGFCVDLRVTPPVRPQR